MAVENAPWAVDGAKHSGAVARTLAYASTSGAEGIVEPRDLNVRATQTPSGSVRVAPGGIAILNRAPSGGQQTYTARNVSETLVDVAATGSGGGRVDYVWAHIIDPEYEGQFPENPQTAQYFFLTASASQPAGNGWYRLARINIPASTATITQAMITDLREVANPRARTELRTYAMLAGDSANLTTTTGGDGQTTGGQTWPQAVETAWGELPIPLWATWVKVVMMWTGVRSTGGNVFGHTWVQIGQSVNSDAVRTQDVKYDFPNTPDTARTVLVAADLKRVPASMRGTRQKFYPRGNRDSGSDSGKFLTLDGGSAMVLQVEFIEQAD